jgi:import inner membrane translocase subunit TIM23
MDWNTFFKKRASLKKYRIGLGISIGFVTLQTTSFYLLTQKKFNPTKLILGMDPGMVYMMGIGLSGVGGYLVGSLLSGSLFRFMNRSLIKKYDIMDARFSKLLDSHRPELVKVTASDNTRILDYFGERIDSLSAYRKWLRVQSRYKKTGKLPHRLFN